MINCILYYISIFTKFQKKRLNFFNGLLKLQPSNLNSLANHIYMEFPKESDSILSRLIEYDSNEKITIKGLDKKFSINKSCLVAFSPKICLQLHDNPNLKEISVPISGNIEEFFKTGKKDSDLFLQMSTALDIQPFIEIWKKKIKLIRKMLLIIS